MITPELVMTSMKPVVGAPVPVKPISQLPPFATDEHVG